MTSTQQLMQVQVPPGAAPGSMIMVNAGGQMVQVPVPPDAAPGSMFQIAVPAAPIAAAVPVVQGVAFTPEMQQTALSAGAQDQVPLLDPTTMGILAATNSFKIHQRVKFWEAISRGCCEQSNTYDIFDTATGAHVFIAQEESEDCLRCCCAPHHSVQVKFKLVNNGERQWSTRGAIEAMPTVMTLNREGCCAKPCLGCWICTDSCKDGFILDAGEPFGAPGDVTMSDRTIAYASQPACGGWFTPTINLFTRSSAGSEKESAFQPTAKVEGPCIFGGCSELCCNSEFMISGMKEGQIDSAIKTGDLATIIKEKPKGFCECGREMFTDSDHFTVNFKQGVGLTPQQKASFMGSLILADYMFFEGDHGPCHVEGTKLFITLFEYYCCGCVCPCNIVIEMNQSGGGGGGPPETQTIER